MYAKALSGSAVRSRAVSFATARPYPAGRHRRNRREIEAVWIERKLDALPAFVGEELLAEAIEHTKQFLEAFSDVSCVIEDLIAEGDKVVGRLAISATHSGPFAGRAAAGKRVSFGSFRIYRVANGKIVETWATQDRLGLLEQLGLVQSTVADVQWAAGERGRHE
jgi:predicted ester cyclase